MIEIDGQVLASKRTFSDVFPGEAFCYENANGLLEIAVNQGSAAAYFHLSIGDEVTIKLQKTELETFSGCRSSGCRPQFQSCADSNVCARLKSLWQVGIFSG